MRLRILFKAQKIPILYRHLFMSLIKEALSRESPEYKKMLYPEDDSPFKKRVKPFTFSVLLPNGSIIRKEDIWIDKDTKVNETVFYLPSNSFLSLFISSMDYEFLINLYNGLLKQPTICFGDNVQFQYYKTLPLKEKQIYSDEVVFKTLSPILIEDKEQKPLLPEEKTLKDFNFHFYEIHQRIFKDIRGSGLRDGLKFIPLDIKKKVVKHTLRDFRAQTKKPFMMLTCFEGSFLLKAHPEDLKLLYEMGVGLRTGQGFGMVEVV